MSNNVTEQMRWYIHLIDEKTEDLLDIADVLDEHQVNVKLENGRYLNPAGGIRTKISTLWKYVQSMELLINELESEN